MGRNPEKLECDLVMRGGITSGIVYPRAIAKLAETYNFRSIGGTSAGAIAAAATAAAQFGANNGDDRFQTIYELPKKLAELKDGKSTLERLFQPQPGTSRLFSLLMSGLEREGTFKKILRIVTTGLANYWCYSVAGAAVTLIPLLWVASASGLSGVTRAVIDHRRAHPRSVDGDPRRGARRVPRRPQAIAGKPLRALLGLERHAA